MSWTVRFTDKAVKDVRKLREPTKSHVRKAITKVAENPLPNNEGGYGKPLGNLSNSNLHGYLKIKLRGDGVRIVYRLERTAHEMVIVIVGIRDDDYVYQEAAKRIQDER